MKRTLLSILLGGLLAGGLFAATDLGAAPRADDPNEQWVNANLLRVYVNGQWEEVPMIPLARHLCESAHPIYEKYCD